MSNLIFKSTGSTVLTLSSTGAIAPVGLQYSKNNGSWTDYTIGTAIQLDNNDQVAFNGSAKFSKSIEDRYFFTTTGQGTLAIKGDLMSLVSSSTVENDYQFNSLFSGCTNIVDASQLVLNATNATKFCFANLFMDCFNLTSPPILSATSLDQWCYSSMFGNCIKLSSAPALVATTLAKYCYYCMFYNCKSLITSPHLSASTLTDWCYNSMFYGCNNLSSITSDFTSWSPSNATTNWVTGIDTIGQFDNNYVEKIYGVDGVPVSWGGEYKVLPLTFKSTGITAVKIEKDNLSYSKNDSSWESYNKDYIYLNNDQTVAFSGTNNKVGAIFVTSGNGTLNVYGNANSLINWTNTIQTTDCFRGLFKSITNLINAQNLELPATTLGQNCYMQMFEDCTGLRTAPQELPATNLAQNCYDSMFHNCYALTSVPSALPATTLYSGCYKNMFNRCQKLSTVYFTLPAIELVGSCYDGMFYICSSLVTAPDLPATTLASQCYCQMFYGCKKLNQINVGFTEWKDDINATYQWFYQVAANGTFTCPAQLGTNQTITRDISHCPSNWTVINQ